MSQVSGGSALIDAGSAANLNTVLTGGNTTGGRNISMTDSDNIVLGTTVGSQIGTGTTQKLGFFGATPIANMLAMPTSSAVRWGTDLSLSRGAASTLYIGTGTAGNSSGALKAAAVTTNGLILPKLGSDPTPVASSGQIYTKDVAGVAQLFFMDETGTVVQVT